MNANLSHILGTELLCAAQGNEFRTPLQADKPLQGVIATLREVSHRGRKSTAISHPISIKPCRWSKVAE